MMQRLLVVILLIMVAAVYSPAAGAEKFFSPERKMAIRQAVINVPLNYGDVGVFFGTCEYGPKITIVISPSKSFDFTVGIDGDVRNYLVVNYFDEAAQYRAAISSIVNCSAQEELAPGPKGGDDE